jgi:hypothetical protein
MPLGRSTVSSGEGRWGEGDMISQAVRGRLASIMAGVVATSMLAFTAGTAAAVEPGSAGAVTAATQRSTTAGPVLSNTYGTMKARIRGTFGKNGVVTGTFTPRRFAKDNGALEAVGMLHAKLTRADGTVVGTKDKVVTLPVKSAQGTPVGRVAPRAPDCAILHLVLGPLDLNLLGLKVHLDKVVLNIDAAPGAGNLLGNLLCAVAGLLDNSGVLTQVKQILNSVLAILRL